MKNKKTINLKPQAPRVLTWDVHLNRHGNPTKDSKTGLYSLSDALDLVEDYYSGEFYDLIQQEGVSILPVEPNKIKASPFDKMIKIPRAKDADGLGTAWVSHVRFKHSGYWLNGFYQGGVGLSIPDDKKPDRGYPILTGAIDDIKERIKEEAKSDGDSPYLTTHLKNWGVSFYRVDVKTQKPD